MKLAGLTKGLTTAVAGAAIAVGLAAPAMAQPEPDTAFAKRLQAYGIYGQKDYNAWIAKIACKRLNRGVDKDAVQSAKFVFDQLQRGSTTEQSWQFLGEAIPVYCPNQMVALQRVANPAAPAPAPVPTGPPLPAER